MVKVTVTINYDSVEEAIVGLGNMIDPNSSANSAPVVSAAGEASKANQEINKREKEGAAAEPLPAAQELIDKYGLNADDIPASGKGSRVTKKDVENYMKKQQAENYGEGSGPDPDPVPAGGSPDLTLEDLKPALAELNNDKGIETCRAVLQRFGANRLSDLKQERYADFKAKCEAVKSGEAV